VVPSYGNKINKQQDYYPSLELSSGAGHVIKPAILLTAFRPAHCPGAAIEYLG
jgi:hypothetical protein